MEAEMARQLLMPHVRSEEGPGVKELTVSDSHITVLVPKRAMWGVVAGGQGWSPRCTPAVLGLAPPEGAQRAPCGATTFNRLFFFSSFSRLTGEDPFEIRDYILSCLDQLSLMAFPPCFYIEPTLEKGT